MTPESLRYEDAAIPVTMHGPTGEQIATGWLSARTKHFYQNEHAARYHDATEFPCACGGRNTERGYVCCKSCREKSDADKWDEAYAKAIDWDGKTPLATWDDDQFFWDSDGVACYLDSFIAGGGKFEDVRLVLCTPDNGREFEMTEFLSDCLPDDDHGGGDLDTDEIDKTVNDWIASHSPFSWWPSKKPVKIESLRELLPSQETA